MNKRDVQPILLDFLEADDSEPIERAGAMVALGLFAVGEGLTGIKAAIERHAAKLGDIGSTLYRNSAR